MEKKTELVARFLEHFAYQVEDESKSLPMIPKSQSSWVGFTHDADTLLRLLAEQSERTTMKNESDKRSELVKFEDEITAAIDAAAGSLTIAETIGVLELAVHVLKCRFYPPKPKPE